MVDIVTRLGKGSPLTNAEVDANFTNLAEVSGVTGEPMGHEDRTTSTISFNASTRTFTIAPTASSFTVWCKGKKVVVSSARTVTIPNTTGMYSIYFDSTGTLAAKSGYFTFAEEAPTAYIYWNATTGTAPYFGDERHGVVLDWQTHEYLHRTRGAALASGFSASGYVLGGSGSLNSHAQLTLEGGTFFDEDMKIIVTATNTPTAGTWEQDLTSPARIPVLYLSGTAWVIDSPTDYPLKQGTARPQYNAFSGGVWSTADVANNKYATSWILATNNLTYPVIAIIGQAQSDLQSAAEAVDFTELQLPGFPSVEFRPLYKLIFQCADSCTNAVHASLVSITDIRSIAAAGTAASIVTDHGNLSGLSDDDHPQYIHVDTLRTVSAAVKASFLPSQTSNDGKFLQTNGTATSWAALSSSNVTTALGFTPYNATNPSGFISGITSGMVTTALGFTPYNATNPSGYVNAAGARGAISVTGAGSYDSATGVINIVGGVTSFNTRTGAITLSSSDVTTALGFTPYNSTNPNGYLTGITSTQVTTALGYTPYNSSNPSGYITGITSGMVTTALGFTPYNNSNPSGYITSAALSPYLTTASAASTYLALSGGTLTGTTYINTGGGYPLQLSSSQRYMLQLRNTGNSINSGYGWWFATDTNFNFAMHADGLGDVLTLTRSGVLTLNGNTVLHAGNYNSYSPTLTGGGASGTWAINITGSAATATDSTKLPLAGGTMSGKLKISLAGGTTPSNFFEINNTVANNGNKAGIQLNTGPSWSTTFFTEQGTWWHAFGSDVGTYHWGYDGTNLKVGTNIVLHAGNYTSYAATAGHNHTYDVNNAWLRDANDDANVKLYGNTRQMVFRTDGTTEFASGVGPYAFAWMYGGDAASERRMLLTSAGRLWTNTHGWMDEAFAPLSHVHSYLPLSGGTLSGVLTLVSSGTAINISGQSDSFGYNATAGLGTYIKGTGATYIYGGGKFFDGAASRDLLHANNFSSYALPLSGGTLSGSLTISPSATLSFGNGTRQMINLWSTNYGIGVQSSTTYFRTDSRFSWHRGGSHNDSENNPGGGTVAMTLDSGSNLYVTSNIFNAGNQVLHAGNYSSYALPLSGGTVAGPVFITGNDNQLFIDATSGPTAGIFLRLNGANRWEIYNSSNAFGLYNYSSGQNELSISAATGVANFRNTPTAGGNAVLHAGNWTNYVQVSYSGWPGYPGTDANTFLGGSWVRTSFTYSNNAPLTGTIATFPSSGYDLQLNANYNGHDLYFRSRNGDAGSWMSWKRVLTDNNYTSYSPSLTGSGASGTWGISVTGNAATAGGLAVHDTQGTQNSANQIVRTQVNGYTMLGWINTTSGDSGIANRLTRIYSSYDEYVRYSTLTDFKVHMGLSAKNSYSRRIDYTSDANYHVGSMGHNGYGANETFHGGSGFIDIWSGTNYPPSTSHIHGFNALHYTTNSLGSTGGNAYGIQVVGQYDQGGLLFSRGCNGGSFSAWRRQLDDNNYNSYAPTLTGGNASGTWGISVTGSSKFFKYDDGPRNLSDRPPNWNNRSVIFDFVGAGTGNGAGNYAGVLTFVPWDGTSASTGDSSYQLAFANQSGVNASGPARLSIRNGINSSWNGWQEILSSSNYSSYALPLSGGTMSGQLYIRNTSPTIYFQDTDNRSAMIHVNSNIFYVLRGSGVDSTSWSQVSGLWPLEISLETNNAVFGGNVTAYSDDRIKSDWAPLAEDFVSKLANVKNGTFTRIDTNERQIGVSAQSLQGVAPEGVLDGKYLSVAYGNVALASAVELAKDNVKLRARIERLESLIHKLIGD